MNPDTVSLLFWLVPLLLLAGAFAGLLAGLLGVGGGIVIVPATVLTVPTGAKLANSLSQTGLRRAFALFLGITAVRMFADIF